MIRGFTCNIFPCFWRHVEYCYRPKRVFVDSLELWKGCNHLFWARIGREIPVFGGLVHQDITHASPYQVCLKPRFLEAGCYTCNEWGDFSLIHTSKY